MFQFNSSSICLTYSNVAKQGNESAVNLLLCNSTELSKFLCSVHDKGGIQYIVVSKESHKDGNTHFHAGIKLKSTFRTRDDRFWDWNGLHPNVQSARQFIQWVKYVKKDGDFIEEGFLLENKPGPKEIIEMAKEMDKLEFLATMSTFKLQYAPTIWEMAHPDLTSTITDDDCLDTTKFVDPSILQFFLGNRWIEGKVLVMYGETGLGKTSMAKILIKKPALMVSHLDDLKKFRVGYHQGILFDDVSVKHIPETGQIHLVDWFEPRSIHVRYGTVFIPKHTPKIFTCNEYPLSDHSAITRRIQSVHVTKFK